MSNCGDAVYTPEALYCSAIMLQELCVLLFEPFYTRIEYIETWIKVKIARLGNFMFYPAVLA
jgi:hypothetical protein